MLRALTVPGYGWRHHPAVLMWKGYEEALVAYGRAVCVEWCRRGKADTCHDKIVADARSRADDMIVQPASRGQMICGSGRTSVYSPQRSCFMPSPQSTTS